MSEMAGSGAERLSKSTHAAEGIVAVPSTASLFQDLQGQILGGSEDSCRDGLDEVEISSEG